MEVDGNGIPWTKYNMSYSPTAPLGRSSAGEIVPAMPRCLGRAGGLGASLTAEQKLTALLDHYNVEEFPVFLSYSTGGPVSGSPLMVSDSRTWGKVVDVDAGRGVVSVSLHRYTNLASPASPVLK